MPEFEIEDVGKDAMRAVKKHPLLFALGAVAAAGAGLWVYMKRKEPGAALAPATLPEYEEPPPAVIDEELIKRLMEEQSGMLAAMLEEWRKEQLLGLADLGEMLKSYLSSGAPTGGEPKSVTYYVYQQLPPDRQPSLAPTPAESKIELPVTLTGTEHLYTERQAKTILDWAKMELKAQKEGAWGTSALPELAGSGLTVVYHSTGHVEFVPEGEKPTKTEPLIKQTEAQSIGARIAMLQSAYEAASPAQKQALHREAERLRKEAQQKGIAQEVEKARLETWAKLK